MNCILENHTSVCSSSAALVMKQPYYVCMHMHNMLNETNTEVEVTYHMLVNEVTYNLANMSTECQNNCCIYNNLLREITNPTCVLLQNTLWGSDNDTYLTSNARFREVKDLCNSQVKNTSLTISLQKKHDAVEYTGGLTALFAFLIFIFVLCTCALCIKQSRKTHPNQYCIELKIGGHSCLHL